MDESKRCIFDVELRGLAVTGNKVALHELVPGFIAKSKLLEVNYECFTNNEMQGRLIPLEVKEFILIDRDDRGKEITAEFSTEELQRYDRENAIYLVINRQGKERLLSIVSEFQGLGSGEYSHVGDWLNCLLNNLEGEQDHDSLISSLEELKSATNALINKIREVADLSMLEEKIDSSVPINETTYEDCSHCEGGEQEIPTDKPSICKNCGCVLFPCSACWDVIDYKKSCDWNEINGCWRFSYASPLIANVASTKMNTKFSYLYCIDASNYKQSNTIVLKGILSKNQKAEIRACLQDGKFFIPTLVGLEDLWHRFGDPNEYDHRWHVLEGIEDTDEVPIIILTAELLLASFKGVKGRW